MFLHVSVILFTGGVSGEPPRDQADTPRAGRPPRTRETPLGPGRPPQAGRTPPDQADPPGTRQTPQDQADTPLGPGRHPPRTRQTPPDQADPPGSRLQHMVYERPVCILLECILVTPVCHSVHKGRGSLSGGVSVQGGSLSRWRVAVQGEGRCPGEGFLSGGSLSRRGLCPERVSVQGGLCPAGGSMSRGGSLSSGGGSLSRVGSLSGGVSVRDPPPPPYGYVRAVRILLECILVFECFYVEMSRQLTCCVAVSSRRCSAVFPFKKLWQCTNGIVVCI